MTNTTRDAALGLPDVPAERLADLCRRRGIRELAVFGSRVHGTARPDSDLDVLVEFAPGAGIGWSELTAIEDELAGLFGHPIDLVPKDGLKRRLRARVLREARTLYAG